MHRIEQLEKAINENTRVVLTLVERLNNLGPAALVASPSPAQEKLSEMKTEVSEIKEEVVNCQLDVDKLQESITDMAIDLRESGKLKEIMDSYGYKKLFQIPENKLVEVLDKMKAATLELGNV